MGNPEPVNLLRRYRMVLVATANFAGRSARAMVSARPGPSGDGWLAANIGTGWRTAAIEAARLPAFATWFTTTGS